MGEKKSTQSAVPLKKPEVLHTGIKSFLSGSSAIMAIMFGMVFVHSISGQHVTKNPAVVWEDLPYIHSGVSISAHTSKSPLNETIQDFMNYTGRDGSDYDLSFSKGKSGMLIHAWFAFLSGDLGNMKLYLSNRPKPSVSMPFTGYFNTNVNPYLLWKNGTGSENVIWWAFPCMPFDSQFKAVSTNLPQWYQFTMHSYREKRFSENISQADLASISAKMQQPAGTFPGVDSGNGNSANSVSIPANGFQTLLNVTNPGVLRLLRITPSSIASALLDSTFIRITTDSLVTAYLPISFFFGGYANATMNNAKGMPAGYDGTRLYCYFPMPFWKTFRVELENKRSSSTNVSYQFRWSDSNPYPSGQTGVFKVQYNPPTPVAAGQPDFVNLGVQGSGIMVGACSQLTGDIEGNFSIHIDGIKTPNVESTGGEDYFNHAYGIHPGFSQPFSGGLAVNTGYRFHIIDYIPFTNSISFTQDHAHWWTHDRDGVFNSAVFYYHNPKQFLILTDSIDIGTAQSESAHSYQISGTSSRLQADTGCYEGNFKTKFIDSGRWTNGQTSFNLRIISNNDGVRLRKRINQTAFHQEVNVYVDNVLAGVWFEQGANYVLNTQLYYSDTLPNWQKGNVDAKFRETEFEIQASLTSGKSTIAVRMQTAGSHAVNPKDSGMTNEYFYWAYSYLPMGSNTAVVQEKNAPGKSDLLRKTFFNRVDVRLLLNGRYTVTVLNLAGKTIAEYCGDGSKDVRFPTNTLPEGVAIVWVRQGKQSFHQRLMVTRQGKVYQQ